MRTLRLLPLIAALCALLPPQIRAAQPSLRALYQFSNPAGGLVPNGLVDAGGALYGTTQFGGAGGSSAYGAVFEMQPPAAPGGKWTQTILYTFYGLNGDGAQPLVSPTVGPGGVLYGTTRYGGIDAEPNTPATGDGVVYELAPSTVPGGAWTETVLYKFTGFGDGNSPQAGLVLCRNPAICTPGALFGTTVGGGAYGYGVVFELDPPATPGGAWTETVLYSFAGAPDGQGPTGIVMADDGALYGVTVAGGGANVGTVFELAPPAAPGGAWTQTVLYTFKAGRDGSVPYEPPLIGKDGTLYGTTGGCAGFCKPRGDGLVFALQPPAAPGGAWTKETLYSFGTRQFPQSPLVSRGGAFFGGTGTLGPQGGRLFKLQRQADGTWANAFLHKFRGKTYSPAGNFVMDKSGTIIGTTVPYSLLTPTSTAYKLKP